MALRCDGGARRNDKAAGSFQWRQKRLLLLLYVVNSLPISILGEAAAAATAVFWTSLERKSTAARPE